MTKVRIKSKGQFFGKVGTVAKILNQHQVVVRFENIKGLFTFSHRAIQIVDTNELHAETLNVAQIERESQNRVLEELINDIAKDSAEFESYQTEAAEWYVKGMTRAMQLASSKLNIKLS